MQFPALLEDGEQSALEQEIFGATNQLLGGLAFLVVLFWLKQRKAPIWFIFGPVVLMLILPGVAMCLQLFHGDEAWLTGTKPNVLLSAFAIATLVLEVWIIVEGIKTWRQPSTEENQDSP